jgi:hypothetical protein
LVKGFIEGILTAHKEVLFHVSFLQSIEKYIELPLDEVLREPDKGLVGQLLNNLCKFLW